MILDTSALNAILRAEPDAADFAEAIEAAASRRMSAANCLEAAVVIDSARDPVVSRRFDELCAAAEIQIEPVTEAQARIARDAYRDSGKAVAIRQGLPSATASPMRWRRTPGNHCCSKARISSTPTWLLCSPSQPVDGRAFGSRPSSS
ncbi:type II toxin-antitoxin system VapC family toxin [Kribbella sp. NPDC000426]|uniref:type II toxin-antitoxin system VapC family toxin n=1 Tax=Kribbella sp. NPDC000426 TaxID=3154255 RepID=UPI00332827F8